MGTYLTLENLKLGNNASNGRNTIESLDGNNPLGLQTQGSSVGIGTSNPGTILEIESSQPYITLKSTKPTSNASRDIESKLIFENSSGTCLAVIEASEHNLAGYGQLIFSLNDADGEGFRDRFSITNNGVGIGVINNNTGLKIEDPNQPYITLKNSTDENTDGGCESRIIFEDHSGTSLAQIQASHDGTNDDTKGDLIFSTHDNSSLVERMRIDSDGKVTVSGDLTVTENLGIAGATNPGVSFAIGEDDTGINYVTGDKLDFLAANNRIVTMTGSSVGIGTDNPNIQLAIGDNNTGFQQQGSNTLAMYTNNTERIRIDSDGEVNISGGLDVTSGISAGYDTDTTAYFGHTAIGYNGYSNSAIFSHIDQTNDRDNYALLQYDNGATSLNCKSGQHIEFRVSNADKMRLLSSGNLGINENTPLRKLHIHTGSPTNGEGILLTSDATSGNNNSFIAFTNTTSVSQGIRINGFDLNNSTQNNSRLIFQSCDNSGVFAGSPGNILAITREGKVSVGQGTGHSTYKFYVNGSAGGTANWNSSDDRIKYNEENINGTSALSIINRLQPQKYEKIIETPQGVSGTWIPTDEEWPSVKDDYVWGLEAGLIAQDIQTIEGVSFAVSGTEVDSEGTQTPLGLNYTDIFTYHIAATKELSSQLDIEKAKVSTLETQVADLLARVTALENP